GRHVGVGVGGGGAGSRGGVRGAPGGAPRAGVIAGTATEGADQLKRMSDGLRSAKAFTYRSRRSVEVPAKTGQFVMLFGAADVALERPLPVDPPTGFEVHACYTMSFSEADRRFSQAVTGGPAHGRETRRRSVVRLRGAPH